MFLWRYLSPRSNDRGILSNTVSRISFERFYTFSNNSGRGNSWKCFEILISVSTETAIEYSSRFIRLSQDCDACFILISSTNSYIFIPKTLLKYVQEQKFTRNETPLHEYHAKQVIYVRSCVYIYTVTNERVIHHRLGGYGFLYKTWPRFLVWFYSSGTRYSRTREMMIVSRWTAASTVYWNDVLSSGGKRVEMLGGEYEISVYLLRLLLDICTYVLNSPIPGRLRVSKLFIRWTENGIRKVEREEEYIPTVTTF